MPYESEYYGVQTVPFEQELKHHGIKGQKWGVRRFQNPDGSLTAEGQRRYAKTLTKTFNRRNKRLDINSLPKNKEYDDLQKAYAAYKEASKLEDDYWNNDTERRKYATMAADATYEENGKRYGYTRDEWRYMYTDEDFDQDEIDSFHLYAKDKGIDIEAYHRKVNDAFQKQREAAEAYANSIVGPYGDTKVKDLGTGSYKNGKFVPIDSTLGDLLKQKVMRY